MFISVHLFHKHFLYLFVSAYSLTVALLEMCYSVICDEHETHCFHSTYTCKIRFFFFFFAID